MPQAVRNQIAADGLLIAKNFSTEQGLLDPTSNLPILDDIQGTLLRRDSLTRTGAGNDTIADTIDDNYRSEPLFVPDPNIAPNVNQPWRSRQVHSNQRYHGLQRMANLTSTTSNVFGVWITVGFFEVEPVNQSGQFVAPESHPDGYRLGRELGSDTGNIRRHRAFYLIDRSVPVAYEPGQNHNVDRAVLLRRFIQ